MKVDDAVETLTRFFNDLIGSLVPGTVLVFGLGVMHIGPGKMFAIAKAMESAAVALLVVGLLFSIGHALLAIHEHLFQKILLICRITAKFDESEAKARESYSGFLRIVGESGKRNDAGQGTGGQTDWQYNDLRNVALSVSQEGASLGRRFMFVALLCNGAGTAVVIFLLDFLASVIFVPKILFSYPTALPTIAQSILMLVLAYALFKRAEVFYSRAMTTPFSIAIAEIKFKRVENGTK